MDIDSYPDLEKGDIIEALQYAIIEQSPNQVLTHQTKVFYDPFSRLLIDKSPNERGLVHSAEAEIYVTPCWRNIKTLNRWAEKKYEYANIYCRRIGA